MPDSNNSGDTVVIAIDGPAASGKSTVARELAKRLGCQAFNSGDLYRAMTWACLRRGIDCHDSDAVTAAAESTDIKVAGEKNEYYPAIEGADARAHLRAPEVNALVSSVSAVPAVRRILTAAVRAHALGRHTVIEGRDIASAVFPETPFKFYIDADPLVRQRRRQNQGQNEEIAKRDMMDSSRSVDPLTLAAGATVIDTSALDIPGVVAAILEKLSDQGLAAATEACSSKG